ncbi:MAG: GNAT family N-acetyltransferase [Hyphomicrobiales bacterium]|nr:GNAT family N-acetyltransferase [Hyphomicrobiales bacterium]
MNGYPISIAKADTADIDAILDLMVAYYAFEELPFDRRRTRMSVAHVLETEAVGQIWTATNGRRVVGYIAIFYGYSLESGGLEATLDEFFVVPEERGRGIGRALMETCLASCRERGVVSMVLEVGRGNDAAKSFYEKYGFRGRERFMLMECDLPGKSSAGTA